MKWFFIPVLLLIFFSCVNKQKVPGDILPVAKLPAVLWDVMQADAVVNRRYIADTSLKRFDTSVQLYQQILQYYKTTPGQFKKSIRYYQTRPDLLQVIFDSLQQRADSSAKPIIDSAKTQ